MKYFESLDDIKQIDETVVALGNFDGVHKGHQQIITRTVRSAKAVGLSSAVFTFSNHPSTVLGRGEPVKNILYAEQKTRIIEEMGVDYLINIPFTKEILTMEPERFVKEILVDRLRIREAYCGFNYSFGYKASGTPEVLMHEGLQHGFGLHVQEPYKIDDIVVSSTYIRQLIAEGRMEEVTKFMGRMYDIGGEVIVGNKLGRTIGFPTMNLVIDETMVTPPNGVYITFCTVDGIRYPAVTNVGNKPTIGEYAKNIETHVFNYDADAYGKHIEVEFVKWTRPEQKFAGIEELKKQIQSDCITAKAFHREKGML
ncbi:MAG: bifunctional riboflavin kinase/FAD synthetase [Firmicutes bacterium]|nr:bifunctional riboflavin kinase/FAD synthetase [Bacillota bacterium]